MPRECEEIRVHRLYIHRDMRHTLRSVYDDHRPDCMSAVGNRTHIVDKPEHVRHMGHSDDFRLFRNLFCNILCR